MLERKTGRQKHVGDLNGCGLVMKELDGYEENEKAAEGQQKWRELAMACRPGMLSL